MKKFLLIFLVALLFSCNGDNKNTTNNNDIFTRDEVVNDKTVTSIQYSINWAVGGYSPVDIRIIELSKNGQTHDYVVANNYIGRAGGMAIEHYAGCKCTLNNKSNK